MSSPLNPSITIATSVNALPLPPSATGQARLNELLSLAPIGWHTAGYNPGGVYYGTMLVVASELGVLQDSINYVKNQGRVTTASQSFLDLASMDFFGTRFPRFPQESDSAFRSRILANLLLEGASRNAIIHALNSNGTPVMRFVEPWNPLDCGGWGNLSVPSANTYPGLAGPGGAYPSYFPGGTPTVITQNTTISGTVIWYSPVTIQPPATVTTLPGGRIITVPAAGGYVNVPQPGFEGYGAWGNTKLPYQAFITVLRPSGSANTTSNPLYPQGLYAGFNIGGFTPVAGGYLGNPNSPFSPQDTYQDFLVDITKTFGTVIWRAYTNTDIGQRANAAAPASINLSNPLVQTFQPQF